MVYSPRIARIVLFPLFVKISEISGPFFFLHELHELHELLLISFLLQISEISGLFYYTLPGKAFLAKVYDYTQFISRGLKIV